MCTLVPRKTWKDGKIVRNSNDYAKWAREVAAAAKVLLVDLNEMVARRYDALGAEGTEPLFGDEHTYTSRAGAELNAEVLIEGLRALQPNPLAAFIVTPKQKTVLEFDHAGDIYAVKEMHGDVERMAALLKGREALGRQGLDRRQGDAGVYGRHDR